MLSYNSPHRNSQYEERDSICTIPIVRVLSVESIHFLSLLKWAEILNESCVYWTTFRDV